MMNTYVSHPIYVNYEASRDGKVRHKERKTSVGRITNTGYLRITVNQQPTIKYYTHRLIAEISIGKIPPGYVVDHINGNKLDNRVVTNSYSERKFP